MSVSFRSNSPPVRSKSWDWVSQKASLCLDRIYLSRTLAPPINAVPSAIGEYTTLGVTVNAALLVSGVGADPEGIAVAPVPEPTTGLLVMGGVLGLAVSRRRAGVSA